MGDQGWKEARWDFLGKAKEKMPLARNEMSSGNWWKYQIPGFSETLSVSKPHTSFSVGLWLPASAGPHQLSTIHLCKGMFPRSQDSTPKWCPREGMGIILKLILQLQLNVCFLEGGARLTQRTQFNKFSVGFWGKYIADSLHICFPW